MADDNKEAIQAKIKELQELLVEDGMDENTAEALLFAVQPPSDNIVGNLADLQRMGAIAVSGEIPKNAMPTGDQDVQEASDIKEAFAEPPSTDVDDDRLALGRIDDGDSPPLGENKGVEETEAPNPADIVGEDTTASAKSTTSKK